MASVEWFDGRFHCVWARTRRRIWRANLARSTSGPRATTSSAGARRNDSRTPGRARCRPIRSACSGNRTSSTTATNSSGASVVQQQEPELDGLYLSTLEKGSLNWHHRRIQRRQEVNGQPCSIFASQNPVFLASAACSPGDAHAPRSETRRGRRPQDGRHGVAVERLLLHRRRWRDVALLEPISQIDDAEAQWSRFSTNRAMEKSVPSCATSPRAPRRARNGGSLLSARRRAGYAGQLPERPGLFVHGDRELPPASLSARRRALLPVATGRAGEPSRLLDAVERGAPLQPQRSG